LLKSKNPDAPAVKREFEEDWALRRAHGQVFLPKCKAK
jgi:hypothetical protein